jgi:hypothetical protein
MSAFAMNSFMDRVAGLARRLSQAHLRSRDHEATTYYLETMPRYLRDDIGLQTDADIREAIETGRLRDPARGDDPRRNLLTPHAA